MIPGLMHTCAFGDLSPVGLITGTGGDCGWLVVGHVDEAQDKWEWTVDTAGVQARRWRESANATISFEEK